MLGRQSVRVTYAHKRRRAQNESKKLLSSPLEALPLEMDNLTRSQMARRMLKRTRRVALAEQLEDKNVEHLRDHLAKRIKHTQDSECVSNVEPAGVPFDIDITFQTPFPSSQLAHESVIAKPLVPEQLSPVPAAKRVMSRTSSRNLKENSTHPHILASPFNSRPGSVTSSPKHKGRGRSSRRVLRSSLHAKSRTLSGVLKKGTRRVSRKDSTVSLKDTNKEPPARHIKHQRYPSSPSTSYMRSQLAQEDWIAPPKALSRTFDNYDDFPSPGGSVYSNASFYADQPQSCSTPARSRLRKLPNLHGRLASFSLRMDSIETSGLDVEMMDDTAPLPRQTIHLSGNSIFSSSDEFTVGSLPSLNNGGALIERNNGTSRGEARARVAPGAPSHCRAVEKSQAGHTLAGSFVAEYDVSITDPAYSPSSIAATKILDSEGIPKLSVGEQLLDLPGTSPARGGNLVIRTSRNPDTLTPPVSPAKMTTPCPPPSPASDLLLEFRSMGIRGCPLLTVSGAGDAATHSDEETRRPSISIPLQTRSQSLEGSPAVADSTTKESVKRQPTRNRAGTIRASDFAKAGVSLSGVTPGLTASSLSNVRRTRSGTVVGPDSKLASKSAGLSSRAVRGAPAVGLVTVQSGSGSESDDELLLKGPWIEDLEYLGLAAPLDRNSSEADEMNLGGLWHSSESGPPRRLGLRRR